VTKSGANSPLKAISKEINKLGDNAISFKSLSDLSIQKVYYINDLEILYPQTTKKKGYFTDIFRDHFKHTFISM
jgi:hypothetical protein